MAERWKVTGQRQTTTMANGTFQDAIDVSFLTDDGTAGSVKIPLAQFTPDNVAQAINERVDAIKAVNEL